MRTEAQIQADADANRRPFSNQSEFDYWADSGRGCYDCRNDDENRNRFCPILSVAMLGEGWPKEWTRRYIKFGDYTDETQTRRQPIETTADDPDGCAYVGECTEFNPRHKGGDGRDGPPKRPTPHPRRQVDGQLDIVDAYLDTAIAELTTAPAEQVTA